MIVNLNQDEWFEVINVLELVHVDTMTEWDDNKQDADAFLLIINKMKAQVTKQGKW